jgi:hypothetical protein
MKTVGLMLLCVLQVGCSQNKLSDRDRNLQDRQRSIDLKKSELMPLTGEYWGELTGANGYRQNIKLFLEVREVPEGDGKTDVVLVPKLLGTLRFYFGEDDPNERIDCAIRSSEYIKASERLALVIENPQFKEMVVTGSADGTRFSGSWNAVSVGNSGSIELTKRSLQ